MSDVTLLALDLSKSWTYWFPVLWGALALLLVSVRNRREQDALLKLRKDGLEIYDRACMGFYSLHHQVSEFRGEAAVCCCVFCNTARRQLGVPELKEGKTMKSGPLHKP